MNENFRKKNPAESDHRELMDELLEQVAGGASGNYWYDHEEIRFCDWCENTGPWEIYVSATDPSDQIGMCKTCGNTGFRP